MKAYSKSFADKYATPKATKYRFIMPAYAVSKYKNKDITGQQLIDSSIVLADDERIDLRF